MSASFTWLLMHRCGEGNAAARKDKTPGKGLLIVVSLSCFRRVAALPCYQHRSWELVRCPASSVSSHVVGVTTLSSLLISQTQVPPRMQSRSSPSPLGMQLMLQMPTLVYFQVICAWKCNPGLNFVDKVQSAETTKFFTLRKFVLLRQSGLIH